MLLHETGRTLIEHTYRAASGSRLASEVLVATDHAEIFEAVKKFGGKVQMTSADHASGTDRVAEVAASRPDCDIFVNVQGDEPELEGGAIDLAILLLTSDPDIQMATLATPIRDRQRLEDPNCVKVVLNRFGEAMYFSRSPIPYPRNWNDDLLTADPPVYLQHVGLYAFRREFLLQFPLMTRGKSEAVESLEQLRVLDAGVPIAVGIIDHAPSGIDTPHDYAAFVERQNVCQKTKQ